MVNIKEIGKPEALRRLYNNSRPIGTGFLHYTPEDMTENESVAAMLNHADLYVDYLQGRVIKVDFSEDEFDPYLYDRDNGDGAAMKAIEG